MIEWVAERGGFRAGIQARSDGLFQVHLERWLAGAIPEEPPDWLPVKLRVVLSDNQRSAQALAEEELEAVVPPRASAT
jgi:hypothetical protein